MKRTKISNLTAFVAVFALFALGSCDGFAPTVKVPFTSEAEFNLPSNLSKAAADDYDLLYTWSFNQDINQLIGKSGGNPEKIKESNIKTVTLTYTGDSQIDLTQMITSLRLMVKKFDSSEELVAQSIKIEANSISFELVKGDILNYTMGEEGFTFLLYGKVNRANIPSLGVDLKIVVESELVVELL